MAEEKKPSQAKKAPAKAPAKKAPAKAAKAKDDSHLVGGKLGVGSYFSYACGALGHDMFYGTLSTYFMMFVTSQLFPEGMEGAAWVSVLTFIIAMIRIVELLIDPMIGGVIDQTKTRFGKFKPWIMLGAIVAGIGLIAIFTDFGGLATSSPVTYLIIFAIVYLIMDIFYSFKDIAFWSMMPALSLLNRDREKLGTVARVASTIGQQVVTLSVVPAIAFFQTQFGVTEKISWTFYATVIAVAAALLALVTCLGTKENDSAIIKNAEKVQLRAVFKNLFMNKQLMLCALVYCIFALSTTVTNSLSLYYFKYIFGAEEYFPLVGTINLVSGLIALVLFPFLTKFLTRKQLFVGGGIILVIGYIIYFNAGANVPLVFTGVILTYFPQPLMALIFFMLISDCVEYGQLYLGKRAESATLSIRPLLDKFAGAISNLVVGNAAVICGMTGSVTAAQITAQSADLFRMIMFGIPGVLICIAVLVYFFKIKLSEKEHMRIVEELKKQVSDK